MRILFMGTPDIAATCLGGLLHNGLDVVAVICQPDKPKGRGYVLTPPPVKVAAQAAGIPVYQPEKVRDEAFSELLRSIDPELIVVVAYGKILPPFVIHYPRYGCINLHVSLLPKYRGAAPMQRAVMAGERETGVTVMYMDEGMDTGDVITARSFPIGARDTFETVHDTSAALGTVLLPQVIRDIEAGTVTRTPQDNSLATYAPKIEREECEADFTLPADRLDAIFRGLTPIPLPFTYLPDGRVLKILSAIPVSGTGTPGTVLAIDTDGEGGLTVACGTDAIRLTRLRPEGKGDMSAAAFLRGAHLAVGDRLGK